MQKDIILFIHSVTKDLVEKVHELGKKRNINYRIFVIRDIKNPKVTEDKLAAYNISEILYCNGNKSADIKKKLAPHCLSIAGVICRGEKNIDFLRKVVPHVPYTYAPTESSLLWATDKLAMREQLMAYDPSITPKFTIVSDDSEESRKKIIKRVGFPLVIKPTGLVMSLLVSVCYHEEELEKTIKKVFRKIKKIYKENGRTEAPKVLIEEFMDGKMYSIDAYVNSEGAVFWCPFVHVKTGKEIGFDDFFGYQRLTPTTLKESSQENARHVAKQSIHALGLRNTSAHIELMRTDTGWKVIELGARLGGFRDTMYSLSFGIDHALNDVRIRLDQKPVIPKKVKGYTAVLKFFAKEEGRLEIFKGKNRVQKLESFQSVKVYEKVGGMCLFAKHGGKGVCDVILWNKDRSNLLADVRRVEEYIVIKSKKGARPFVTEKTSIVETEM